MRNISTLVSNEFIKIFTKISSWVMIAFVPILVVAVGLLCRYADQDELTVNNV
ncbi:hypothetical protein D3C85_1198490 [compost metagenome]